MDRKPFVVACCGRSGTMFTWRLLNFIGIRASFEEFFAFQTKGITADDYRDWLSKTGTIGEVSSLAAPYCDIMAEAGIRVIHLVRNPVAVIASLLGLNTFEKAALWSPNVKFNFRHVPEMGLTDSHTDLAMKYWLHWNAMVEPHTSDLYRAEDLTTVSAVRDFASSCTGVDELQTTDERDLALDALKHFGKTWNAKDRKTIRWAQIPDSPLKEQVAKAAERYGYGISELREHCPHCGVL